MYTLLKPLKVREELLKRGVRVFTPQIFGRIFGSSPTSTKYFLETQTHEGFLVRLKRAVYALKTDPPNEEEIANALYQPSYISFEYALAYYNILPEMTYTVTSATTKPTRLFTTENIAYSYRTIKASAYTGYSLVKKGDRSFLLAEPEKSLIDYLYFVSLHRVGLNDRLVARFKERYHDKIGGLRKEKMTAFTKLFGNEQLERVVEQLL
jgi:predicted transcriptional regulator of viral defense system